MEPIKRQKIKMLRTISGTDLDEKGQSMGAKLYHAGEEYFVGPALEGALCDQLKIAERVSEESAEDPKVGEPAGETDPAAAPQEEAKALEGAPENKAKKKGKKGK